jgi:hypothetical protein
VSGVLPADTDRSFFLVPGALTVHAQLPCCAVSSSIAPRVALRLQPAAFAGSFSPPLQWASAAVVTRPGATISPSRVQTALDTAIEALPEPSHSLSSSNALFFI